MRSARSCRTTRPSSSFRRIREARSSSQCPGWDVTSADYQLALALGKAPLSEKLTLRRIASTASDPEGLFVINKYLAQRGDERVKDWASWVAELQMEERRAARRRAERLLETDPRERAGSISCAQDAERAAHDRAQGDVRERHRRVRESGEHLAAVQARWTGRADGQRSRRRELLPDDSPRCWAARRSRCPPVTREPSSSRRSR